LVWFQLGELRLFSVGEISDKGRGIALAILVGDADCAFFEMRRGWTYTGRDTVSNLRSAGGEGCAVAKRRSHPGGLGKRTGSEEEAIVKVRI